MVDKNKVTEVSSKFIKVYPVTVENFRTLLEELRQYEVHYCEMCQWETFMKRMSNTSNHDGSRTRTWECLKCKWTKRITDVDPWEFL